MRDLSRLLKSKLRSAKKIAVLGIGSEIRGDDIAGFLVIKELDLILKATKTFIPWITFYGDNAPENLTGEIKKFCPTHLIIIDAVDMEKKAGEIILVTPDDEVCAVSFSTHRLPIKIMADYLYQSVHCKTLILGVQPRSLMFGKAPSKEIKTSVKKIAKVLSEIAGQDFKEN